jgi:hypothetical protein
MKILREKIKKFITLLFIVINITCFRIGYDPSLNERQKGFQECLLIQKIGQELTDTEAIDKCIPCLVLNCRPNYL